MPKKRQQQEEPKDRSLDVPAEANRDKHINFLAIENGDEPMDRPRERKPSLLKRIFMSNSKRNSDKGNENESRTSHVQPDHEKLPENPRNVTDNASTAADDSNPKYTKTDVRKDEKDTDRDV